MIRTSKHTRGESWKVDKLDFLLKENLEVRSASVRVWALFTRGDWLCGN